VLGDLHLLHCLTQGGAVPGTVLADNTGLLSTLGHFSFCCRSESSNNSLVVSDFGILLKSVEQAHCAQTVFRSRGAQAQNSADF
jgi:hypothetical protein